MILPNSYETILDKIKQDWFHAGWEKAEAEMELGVCPFDCSYCHDWEDCPCLNCKRMREE